MTGYQGEGNPPVGSFFLTQIANRRTHLLAAFGQTLAGHPSRFTHAGVIRPGGRTLEAEPGGARRGRWEDIANDSSRTFLISDAPIRYAVATAVLPQLLGSRERYEAQLREQVEQAALSLEGTPYSFADYLALAALHTGLPNKWLRNYVQDSGHLICSALVDRVYEDAGIELFDDRRLNGDVMPTDLEEYTYTYLRTGGSQPVGLSRRYMR